MHVSEDDAHIYILVAEEFRLPTFGQCGVIIIHNSMTANYKSM